MKISNMKYRINFESHSNKEGKKVVLSWVEIIEFFPLGRIGIKKSVLKDRKWKVYNLAISVRKKCL